MVVSGHRYPDLVDSPSVELYRSESVALGTWRCAPSHPAFPGGHIENPTFVFPRTSVTISQPGRATVVTDSSVSVIYPADQEYERFEVDPVGDVCEWFEISSSLLDELGLQDSVASVRTSPHTYALQRAVIAACAERTALDPVALEDAVMSLVERLCAEAVSIPSATRNRGHRSLADDARAFIAGSFSERLTLVEIGRAIGASPYHLSRVFRQVTGETVGRHLTDIRLRRALDLLCDTEWGLADIAVEVGFASHSHFTKNFRERFGLTPSEFRAGAHPASSKIVTASG